MMTLTYESDYDGVKVTYEFDTASLEDVLDHTARFLRACGEPIDRTEILVPYDEDKEYIVPHAEWHELNRKLDECRGYRVWWDDDDQAWHAENPDNPSHTAHSGRSPEVALSILRGIEEQEKTNASTPIATASQGEWIQHDGSPCPVAGDQLVQVRLRNGVTYTDSAEELRWHHDGNGDDIVAYRTITDWEDA